MLRELLPGARIGFFLHIPFPASEVFRMLPWREDVLRGMLGADLIGFHTQFHCNNFLETVERTIEGRVDWENFTVVRGQHRTWVRPFPISVAPDDEPMPSRAQLRTELGITTDWLGIGVERVDYTKGLPERFRALRRFFERWPEYRRRVTFVQIASLSRSRIPRYRALQEEVREAVRSINEELGDRGWQPIVYRERHHDHAEIRRYYRAADFCMVTSLHDGMNLVAKEYVASQDDDDGSLILSRFTGASRELRDAWVVNPYDVEDVAAAIRDALAADPLDRRSRMRRLRAHVREYNIYGWAGLLIAELARIPQPTLQRG
jgi:trehalose 6-phosphate synthase